jgi:hypothetical protein
MNIYFYSAQTGGFYNAEIHGESIPADVVEITEQEWKDLLDGQSNGKEIVADSRGYPVLQDPPPPTKEETAAKRAQEQAKTDAIAKLTALGLTETDLAALGIT